MPIAVGTRQVIISAVGRQGPAGIDGTDGADGLTNTVSVRFSYRDAQPITIFTSQAGKEIIEIFLAIKTAFNGTNPQLSVGPQSNLQELMSVAENLPKEVGVYSLCPNKNYSSNTAIKLSMQVGVDTTQGSGVLTVLFER